MIDNDQTTDAQSVPSSNIAPVPSFQPSPPSKTESANMKNIPSAGAVPSFPQRPTEQYISQAPQTPLESVNHVRSLHQQLEEARDSHQQKVDELKKQNQVALDQQQQKIEALQKQLKDVSAEKDGLKEQCQQQDRKIKDLETNVGILETDVESLTLDLEINNEKTEQLLSELSVLKEEASLLQSENRLMKENISIGGNGPSMSEFESMKEQYIRLREALAIMRDKSNEDKKEITMKAKEIEGQQRRISELEEQKAYLEQDLSKSKESLQDAMDQLETAQESMAMLESLTEKNLDLNEKLEGLKVAVAELEELRDLSEIIEKDHEQTIQDLGVKLGNREIEIEDLKTTILNTAIEFQEQRANLERYRQLTQKLQQEINFYRANVEDRESKLVHHDRRIQDATTENLKLKADLVSVRRKMYEFEAADYRVKEIEREIIYIKSCIPEGLVDKEHQEFSSVLSMDRILHKIKLLQQYAAENYPLVWEDEPSFDFSDSLVIYENISVIVTMARRFEIFRGMLENANENIFSQYIQFANGIATCEIALDNFMNLLATRLATRAEVEGHVKEFIQKCNTIFSVYELVKDSDVTDSILNMIEQSVAQVNLSRAVLIGIKHRLLGLLISQQDIVDLMDRLNPTIKIVDDMLSAWNQILQGFRYCHNLLKPEYYGAQVDPAVSQPFYQLRNWHRQLNMAFKAIFESLSADGLLRLGDVVQSLALSTGTAGDDGLLSLCVSKMQAYRESVENLSRIIVSACSVEKQPDPNVAEWTKRAAYIRSEILNSVTYKTERDKLRAQLVQMNDLAREKERRQKYLEAQMQSDEKKLRQLQEKVNQGSLEMEQLKKKEKELQQTIQSHENDIARYEEKVRKLQEYSKGSLAGSRAVDSLVADSQATPNLLAMLQYLRAENNSLKGEKLKEQLSSMKPLASVTKRRPVGELPSTSGDHIDIQQAVQHRAAVHDLRKDSYELFTSLKVVRLGSHAERSIPPRRQLQAQKLALKELANRQDRLRALFHPSNPNHATSPLLQTNA
eukprot:TRINITY_DN3492_c0_g1_i4.p1 TRINITY_DN3492_c0_g1~~TRINITY_DN3492_c0_g1_i4.p1  ORF type:complete len:1162 (+),score=298.34 TRINITY_DN3492_c0_g1_i4:418-3486(+)